MFRPRVVRHVLSHVCRAMAITPMGGVRAKPPVPPAGTYRYMCVGISKGMRVDTCVETYVDASICMCVDICVETYCVYRDILQGKAILPPC